MIYCPKCKSEIDSDSHFCDQCGQEIFFCSQCRRPGKGLRCTSCGAPMVRAGELPSASSLQSSQCTRPHVTPRESMVATALGATQRSGIPKLLLVNDSLQMCLAATDGVILGRRNGIYKDILAHCHYISGTHAQLLYTIQDGWTITDKGSSNGTFVNSRKILPNESAPLRHGDRIILANIEFRIEIK